MKVSALLFLLVTQSFAQQVEDHRTLGTIGISAGTGFGIDMGFGRKLQFTDGSSTAWEVFVSLWTPTLHQPTPKGEEGYFDWLKATDVTVQKKAWGIGGRYHVNSMRFGVMLESVSKTSFQNYLSPYTHYEWHDAPKDNETISITGNIGFMVSQNLEVNLFVGPERGFMLGLALHGEIITDGL